MSTLVKKSATLMMTLIILCVSLFASTALAAGNEKFVLKFVDVNGESVANVVFRPYTGQYSNRWFAKKVY
jgi:hypothetical protein